MFEDLKKTYSGKKVLLTGHTGFKGTWLLKIFSMLGAEVTGYALAPENKHDLYHIIKGDTLCNSVIADLRDKQMLINTVIDFQPDFIFHLAAQPLVRLSYQMPSETIEINAIGTANLLDTVRLLDKPCNSILITTDKVYYNNEWEYPYREEDRIGGYDPYSASKACAELVIDSYRNSFFNIKSFDQHQKAIAVGRAGNVIGGGDWAKDRLIPDIIKALSKNEDIEIRNPHSVRPWQHVLEPLAGYLLLGLKMADQPGKYNEAYTFGPHANDAMPVEEMVKLAIKNWGKGKYFVKKEPNQPHEAGLLKLDISKANAKLNWYPKFNALTALSYTIAWYYRYFSDADSITALTEEQISAFFN